MQDVTPKRQRIEETESAPQLREGASVIISGLSGAQQYNGCKGLHVNKCFLLDSFRFYVRNNCNGPG
jgi:hypothetical protein